MTIDAEGCRTAIAEKIKDFFADSSEEDLTNAEWIEVREYFHIEQIAALPRVKEFHGAQSIEMVPAKRITDARRELDSELRDDETHGIGSCETRHSKQEESQTPEKNVSAQRRVPGTHPVQSRRASPRMPSFNLDALALASSPA